MIVYVDTETTGLNPETRLPWEIAMIRSDGRECLIQITDVDLTYADPKALEFGRFYERHCTKGSGSVSTMPDRESLHLMNEVGAAGLVERFTRGCHLVGVNPAFDADVLGRMLTRYKLQSTWNYHLIDLVAMSAGWLLGNPDSRSDMTPPWRSYRLSAWCDVAPPEEDEAHTAMGDARWAQRWYERLMGL